MSDKGVIIIKEKSHCWKYCVGIVLLLLILSVIGDVVG